MCRPRMTVLPVENGSTRLLFRLNADSFQSDPHTRSGAPFGPGGGLGYGSRQALSQGWRAPEGAG
jgi:hypothetical protein